MAKPVSKGMKFLSIIIGALMGGFLWRCRGEGGFGSSWGLYGVGLVIILTIYIFYGKKQGMKYEFIPLGSFLTGLGVTGYATVIEQTCGRLMSDTSYFFDDMPVVHKLFPSNGIQLEALPEYDMELAEAPISVKSGFIIILLMGFTFVPFFSFFVGSLFSKKEYGLQHYAIAVVIFFAVSTIVKATIAHPILQAINPEQVKYAFMSLKDRGYDYGSMFEAYMKNFLDRPWMQQFQFVENYYMSIEHISDVFGVFALIFYAAVVRKDIFTGVVSFLINLFTSISTTALSLLIVAYRNTGFLGNVACPRSLANGAGWAVWEFSTGAAVGFFTMLIIALMPNKYTAQNKADNEPLLKNNTASFAYNFVATVFIFGVMPLRAIFIRANKLLKNLEIIDEAELYGTIVCAIASVFFGIYIIRLFRNNILRLGDTPFRMDARKFSITAFTGFTTMCCLVYFFLNHACIVFLPYSKMTSLSAAWYQLTEPQYIDTTIKIITYIIFAILWFPLRKKLIKEK